MFGVEYVGLIQLKWEFSSWFILICIENLPKI